MDLADSLITPDGSLGETLRRRDLDRIPLTEVISEFVSVAGKFTAAAQENDDVVPPARYGNGGHEIRVKVLCEKSGQRDKPPLGVEFPARCPGKTESWNSATRELSLTAVAVFR